MDKLIIGNMKMNVITLTEREHYLNLLKKELRGSQFKKTKIVLCPPYIHLETLSKKIAKKVAIGAQNMFWERKGSFTGEISPAMLKNIGCTYVILGHSERRRYFGEKDQDINLKILSALKIGLKPILCVGEDKKQKNKSNLVIIQQLENCLKGVNSVRISEVIISYEPVWAISANNPDHLPTTDEIMSVRLIIKKFLVEKYGLKIAEKVQIIYGGSVSAVTVKSVCLDSGMQGALIGKASLDPYEFIKIAKIIDN